MYEENKKKNIEMKKTFLLAKNSKWRLYKWDECINIYHIIIVSRVAQRSVKEK